ncbi:MAG: major facilitator superfamily protein, partial [Pseudonocardiales bacterium]|nr:major facilitator superfamily protein [Pseudonocardiales bacterium]
SVMAIDQLLDQSTGRNSLLNPLRHRVFRLLWVGTAISLLGDGVYLVALAWQAYTLSPKPGALALLGVCATVPQLLALLGGGVLSDRLNRRRILLVTDAVRCGAIAVMASLVLVGQVRMWHLVVVSIIYGLGAGVAAPAFDAIVPDLVPTEDLEQANALEQFLRPAMLRLAGPAVGGLLVATVGVGWGLALDSLSFFISAVCVVLMGDGSAGYGSSESGDTESDEPTLSLLADASAGAKYVVSQVWLWGTFASAAVAYLCFIGPTEVLLPYLIRETMHGTAADFGIVLAAGGVGALVAAAAIGVIGLPDRQLTFMYLTWTVATLAVAGYGLARSGWQLMVICMLINALEAAGTVAWATTKQRLIPSDLLGRVSSLDWFISIAGLPVSYALTAPVAALIGVRMTFVLAGLVGGICTLAALFLPGMRAADGALTRPRPSLVGAESP